MTLLFVATLPIFAGDLKSEWLAELDDVQQKLTALADATPAEKFPWRPADGVRSVSEVYMHIAGAGYVTPAAFGVRPPAGLTRDMEQKVTAKEQVTGHLRAALKHLRDAVAAMPSSDFENRRVAMTRTLNHLHEHLGQSIAYARMTGVVPPWSQPR